MEVQLHAFLTSALDGGTLSASRSGCFTPRETAPDTYWTGGWVDWSGYGGEEKSTQPLPVLLPPIIQPVAKRYPTFSNSM